MRKICFGKYNGHDIDCVKCNSIDCMDYTRNKRTNADKIRSMSDEELAEFISEKIEHGLCFYTGNISDTHGFDKINDSKIHLSWLQSEVSE